MWLTLLIVHIIELAVIGGILLIRRNAALEKAVVEQRQYMDAISIIISDSDAKLRELDVMGAFKADDEVGAFFQNLASIQELLNQFNNRK